MDFDDAYANAAHIPGAAAYPERWRQKAADFARRAAIRRTGRIGYILWSKREVPSRSFLTAQGRRGAC